MVVQIVIAFVCVICITICGYAVGVHTGIRRKINIVKENNKEILIAREHIEYQIQNEKARLKELKEVQEQKKQGFKDFEKIEKENILSNLRDFQIQVNQNKAEYIEQVQELQNELDKLQRQKSAAVEVLQRENSNKTTDNHIVISRADKEDIEVINSFKNRLTNPEIVSKLIWSTYYQKKAKELFTNILGTDKVCGIYKITNIDNQMCYVGQSVDILNRFTQHCRCGCGMKTPKDNKLYAAMLDCGLESFTFEVVEQCPKEELDEKEAYYIKMYNAVNFGYNSQEGVNGKSNN